MNRRLYFLFPDEQHARRAVEGLENAGVQTGRIHAVTAVAGELQHLAWASERQRSDTLHRLESQLWNANLTLFFLALMVLILALFSGATGWAIAAVAVMLVSFIAGLLFTVYVPDGRLKGFRDALAHGEVVLMLDVPRTQVGAVENYLHRRHPEAVAGGASWTVDAFGL